MRTSVLILLMIITSTLLKASELTQTVRGRIIDKDAQIPLIGATIVRQGDDLTSGAITNTKGEFRLEGVPVGRHNFVINYVGYQPYVATELLVSSGKEVVLLVELTESITQLDAVVVKATTQKDQPLNDMATVSSRVFSVEEARRYAGGFDDPTRLASAFAGVSASQIESNGIAVRGNAPSGVQYRMEGVEIEHANHFEGGDLLGGGFVSIFNSHLLANSDFMTGAFPAQYGNALSASFDMKLRNGNSENFEHAFQVGVMGIDLASEGPLKKGSGASYLLNYRYSTFGLLVNMLPEGEGLPVYQDLCFKVNIPSKLGTFSLWGAGAIDNFYSKAKEDSMDWTMEMHRLEINSDFAPVMGGLTHKYILKNNAYMNTSVLYSQNNRKETVEWIHTDGLLYDIGRMKNFTNSLTFSSFVNKKVNSWYTIRTGFNYKFLNFKFDEWSAHERLHDMQLVNNSEGNSSLVQAYSQSKIAISQNITLNAGLHYQHLTLNNQYSIEPRVGIKQKLGKRFAISAAYGRHSRMQTLNHYFVRGNQNDVATTPNTDLDFTRAHHFVLGFDYRVNENTRIKVEPYYQVLSQIPVIADSSFAVINLQDGHTFSEVMVSEGTGTNMGVELTLERFLNRGFYYLLTASLYDSKYVGGDGIERNSVYNGRYVANILAGKEWAVGRNKNSLLGVNGRLYLMGGNRRNPVNYELSQQKQEVVYDAARVYEDKKPGTTRFDLTLSYTRNRPKYTSTLSLQMLNALGTIITYNMDYDYVEDHVVEMEGTSSLPNISWKIEF